MFWDGTRWVDEERKLPTTTHTRAPQRRLTDVLATIPILALAPLLLMPYLTTNAAEPRLSVTGQPFPGATVQVAGTNWSGRPYLQLTWDGSSAGMPTAQVGTRGTFAVPLVVPGTASAAPHNLAAVALDKTAKTAKTAGTRSTTTAELASLTIIVLSLDGSAETAAPTSGLLPTLASTLPPAPTIGPTIPPAPSGTPLVTASPTAAPLPTVFDPPTSTPTPTSTPSPTPAPTPTRTPSPTPNPTPTPPPSGSTLAFAAECNGANVDSRLRALYQPGDPGFGLDSDFMGDLRQVSAGNGYCRITAERRSTPSGRAYASAAMATYNTFAQRYGVFEARIRYPKGAGMWPAFWLLAEGSKQTPPEVDIFEAYPGPGTGSSGADVAVFTNHYSGGTQYVAFDGGGDLTGAWHVWRFEWTPNAIVLRLDGVKVGTLTGHVPSVRMYPIINLALGATGYRVDGSTPDVAYMDVDYLRVYAP